MTWFFIIIACPLNSLLVELRETIHQALRKLSLHKQLNISVQGVAGFAVHVE
jgi:hypothetical protein